MTLSTIVETLINSMYSATLAAIMCIMYREHRLLNLASAGWACMGAWIACTVVNGKTPVAPYGMSFLAILLIGTIGVLGVFLYARSHVFTEHPTLYLFLGLACQVVISVGGGNTIPASISATIPDGVLSRTFLRQYEILVLVATCVLITFVSSVVMRSRCFCKQVLTYRTKSGVNADRRFVVWLLVLQVAMCLAVGALSVSANQGNFALTGKHMATSAVAVIATFGRPWRAFFSAIGLALVETLVYFAFPNATISSASSLLIFVFATIAIVRPVPGLALTIPNPWLRRFAGTTQECLTQMAVIIFAPGVLWGAWVLGGMSESRLMSILVVLVFSSLSYVFTRCCGIATASLPAFGASLAYLATQPLFRSTISVAAAMGVLFICFAGYLWFLRFSNHRIGLVTDLALILVAHELLGMSEVGGVDGVGAAQRVVTASGGFAMAYLCGWGVFALAMAFAAWIHVSPDGRLMAFTISDPLFGCRNGINSNVRLLGVIAACLFGAFFLQCLLVEQRSSISVSMADPQLGIGCLMVGYLMASDNPLKGFFMGLFMYILPEDVLPLCGLNVSGEFSKILLVVPILAAIYWSPESRSLWRVPGVAQES